MKDSLSNIIELKICCYEDKTFIPAPINGHPVYIDENNISAILPAYVEKKNIAKVGLTNAKQTETEWIECTAISLDNDKLLYVEGLSCDVYTKIFGKSNNSKKM